MKSDSLRSLLSKDRRVLILTAALNLGALSTAVFVWFYWRAQHKAESLDEKNQILTENIGQSRVLDDTLTMSAKMVAAADASEYEDLYKNWYDEIAVEY